MFRTYISSALLFLLVTACSVNHTARIKQQLGDSYNEQAYKDAGGERKSKERYQTFCTVIKQKKYNAVQLKLEAASSLNDSKDLNLVNAEINLAAKDCK